MSLVGLAFLIMVSSCEMEITTSVSYLALDHVWGETKGDSTNVQELLTR